MDEVATDKLETSLVVKLMNQPRSFLPTTTTIRINTLPPSSSVSALTSSSVSTQTTTKFKGQSLPPIVSKTTESTTASQTNAKIYSHLNTFSVPTTTVENKNSITSNPETMNDTVFYIIIAAAS